MSIFFGETTALMLKKYPAISVPSFYHIENQFFKIYLCLFKSAILNNPVRNWTMADGAARG